METAVLGVLVRDKKILLLQYADYQPSLVELRGTWGLPGGRMRPGETKEDTLRREVKEETRLAVKTLKKCFEADVIYKLDNKTRHVVVYRCDDISGEVRLSREHISHEWADIAKLDTYNFIDDGIKGWIRRAYATG